MALNPVTSHPDLSVSAVLTADAVNYSIDGILLERPAETPEGTRVQLVSFTTDPNANLVSGLRLDDYQGSTLVVADTTYTISDYAMDHSSGIAWSSLNLTLKEIGNGE